MSIIALSSRLLRRRTNIFCIRNATQERPNLKFGDRTNLANNQDWYNDQHHSQNNEPIDAIGYSLLGIPILSFLLGTWQINRRRWKLELLAELEKKTSMPPQPLPQDLKELEQMEYCPIKVRGEYLYEKEFAIGPKSLIKDGAAASEKLGGMIGNRSNLGHNLITPFKVENRDTIILVNRGWIPSKLDRLPKEKLGHVPGPVEITGIVRLNETRQGLMPRNTPTAGIFTYRDIETMAFLADSDPVFIDLIESSGVPDGPIAGQTRVTLRNEHATYILTWYTLSLLTAFMWHRQYIRKLPQF